MPCCSKELSSLSLSLCLFPSSSPSAHVRLSKDAEKQTWSYRRPAEQSQSHHLHLSKHSGERGRQKREGEKVRGGGGTNSLHDTGWVFRLEYTVCKTVGWVGMWRDGENLCTSARYRQKQWKENRKLKKWRSCAKGNLIPHNAGTDCEAVLGIQEYL